MLAQAHHRTLAAPAIVEGVALFTGNPCVCTIHPAPAGHGLVFVRDGVRIPVNAGAISFDPVHPAFASIHPRCSAVARDGTTVWLVEHVLSALSGMGISDALIETTGAELPIDDGSAMAFVEAIRAAGIVEHGGTVSAIELRQPLRIEQDGSWIRVTPSETTSYEYTIDYGDDSPITRATVRWDGDIDDYADRIAPARTFCLEHEAEMLQSAGLFAHLSAGDMLVLGEEGPIGSTLRDPCECAHHKLLDLIGDIALLGKPIKGHIRAHKSGHAMAHALVAKIADQQ